MKKNINEIRKNNSGITLVALVVTIVVLLILAGITITMLFSDSGIITKAREAAEATKKAQSDTEQGLANLTEDLAVASGEYDWKLSEDGKTVSNKNYPEGIAIGSYVKYNCTPVDGSEDSYVSHPEKSGFDEDQTFTASEYSSKDWKLLGVDNRRQLLLISDEPVYNYYFYGKKGYENVIEELNKICDLYGHGKGATGGRMLTIEEVNKITGLNGNNIDGKGTKYDEGLISEYGNKVTYYWDGTDYPYYESSNGLKGNSKRLHVNGFTWLDEGTKEWKTSERSKTATTTKKEKITTITNIKYRYSLLEDFEIRNPELFNTLFNNTYLIATDTVTANDDLAAWGVGYIDGSDIYSENFPMVWSDGHETGDNQDFRPLVSLKSNIKLKENGKQNGCIVYDIEEN